MTTKGGLPEKERKEVTKGMETKSEMRVRPDELRGTVDYLSEVSVLKRTPRAGWRFAGPPVEAEQDYVASHSFEVAQLAYILGRMEGLKQVEALRSVGLAVFHDNDETRLPDRDKVTTHYLGIPRETFSEVLRDQISLLPKEIGEEIFELAMEANFEESPEAIIVRDADILEASIQAKIFHERGFTIPEDLLRRYLDSDRVQTRSAKRLMNALRLRKDLATRWLKGSLNV